MASHGLRAYWTGERTLNLNKYLSLFFVLDWGAQVGKHLHLGSPDPTGTTLAPVADILEGDSDKETLVGLDIVTLGDLVQDKATVDGSAREWLSNKDLNAAGLKDLIPVLRGCPLPIGDIIIRVGSCLCLDGCADVLEFLGWVNDMACVRRWSPVSPTDRCTVNSRYKINSVNRSKGAGTDELLHPSALLAKSRRVLMTPDVAVGRKPNTHIEKKNCYYPHA